MPKRTKVLKAPYSAYLRAESSGFDEELCRVARATPCGEYLRRFWQPVCIESELNDTPTAVRIMGEDLVVFKDGAGRVGPLVVVAVDLAQARRQVDAEAALLRLLDRLDSSFECSFLIDCLVMRLF